MDYPLYTKAHPCLSKGTDASELQWEQASRLLPSPGPNPLASHSEKALAQREASLVLSGLLEGEG